MCLVAVVLLAAARVGTAFAANSGWYTMVDDRVPIPYGIADAKLRPDDLRATFTKDLVVLLGEEDNNPNHHRLNREAEARAQGRHRFERGVRFFETAGNEAKSLQAPFRWRQETVPGTAHNKLGMSETAADLLSEKTRDCKAG